MFINMFKKVWEKLAKIEYVIKGFKEVEIFPLNSQNVKKGKLAPSIYEHPDHYQRCRRRASFRKIKPWE